MTSTKFTIIKSWALTALTFLAIGLIFGGSLVLDNSDVVQFWGEVFGR